MTNPNGANQYKPDPRQALFLTYYLDPKSETFSNCLQSGLKAGFSQEYSENLLSLMPEWLSDVIEDNKLIKKAEKVLDKTLNFEVVDENGKIDNALLRTQTDVAKFIQERLNKSKYSTRQEVTGKDGDSLKVNITSDILEIANETARKLKEKKLNG